MKTKPHKGDIRADGFIFVSRRQRVMRHGIAHYDDWYSPEKFAALRLRERCGYVPPTEAERKAHRAEWVKKYLKDNQERIGRVGKAYRAANPQVRVKAKIKRRSLESLDPSANPKLIRQLYLMRDRVSWCTGMAWDVDHILPLVAGGKHHEDNLRVITHLANIHRPHCSVLDKSK